MKQQGLLAILLLLAGTDSSTTAHRIHINHQHKQQLYNRGIFDKAIAKIEKEQSDKEEAVTMLHELQEKEKMENKISLVHQKHLMAAQKEAEQMLRSMQNEAEMTAQEKLETIVGEQIKDEEAQKQEKLDAEEGINSGFLKNVMHPEEDPAMAEAAKKNRILSIQDKVHSVVAPKLAEEALSQAVLSSAPAPENEGMGVSITQMNDMKRNLAEKFSQKAEPKPSAPASTSEFKVPEGTTFGNALDQYNKLPVTQATNIDEEKSISEVAHESAEKKDEITEAQIKINAAHKKATQLAEKTKMEKDQRERDYKLAEVPKDMENMDNPIAEMTLMRHPDIMKKASQYNYEDDMFSYNGPN